MTNFTLKEMGFYDSCSDPRACQDAKDEFNPSDYLLELMQDKTFYLTSVYWYTAKFLDIQEKLNMTDLETRAQVKI